MKKYPMPALRGGATALCLLVAISMVAGACSSDPEPESKPTTPTPPSVEEFNSPQQNLADLKWEPKFEPDYVNLTPLPGVEPATKEQQEQAVVKADGLEFPADKAGEVRNWQPGRIVVSAPSETLGGNPFGYARKVVSVTEANGKITVLTENATLEDLVEGDFQVRVDQEAKAVPLANLDLDSVAANLYQNSDEMFLSGIGEEGLIDDEAVTDEMRADPEGIELSPGHPFFHKKVAKAVTGAAKAVAKATTSAVTTVVNGATSFVAAVTPKTLGEGSVAFSPDLNFGPHALPIFKDMNYEKTIKKGKYPIVVFIKGSADVTGYAKLNPGFQIGGRIPNPINKNAPPLKMWVNVDSRAEASLGFALNLEAGIKSVSGPDGTSFDPKTQEGIKKLNENLGFAQDVYGREKEALTGDGDMKPAGGWKKTLYMSSPSTRVFFAGPVPVVIVSTVQVDLECGFEAKVALKGTYNYNQAATFKFKAEYEKGQKATLEGPTFNRVSNHSVNLTGSGEASIACGLIPRINTLLYDTIGLTVGMRGSLVGKAKIAEKCESATSTRPNASVTAGLYASIGVQIGARLQAPGSSFAGKSGTGAGFDIGPLEPWTQEFKIYEKEWNLGASPVGYCTPLCKNGAVDESIQESDRDCGGLCTACGNDKKCIKNSDCARPASCSAGVCKVDKCADNVLSGTESDVDCGGSCAKKCETSRSCHSASDCASGFCNVGQHKCVANHCLDGIKNADEGATDLGGKDCPKCPIGAACGVPADCQNGLSNGSFCVATSCSDRKVSANESGLDCGGTSSCTRCGLGGTCGVDGDCAADLKCAVGKCIRPPAPTCTDSQKNGNETDVDCGGSCGTKCTTGKVCGVPGDCQSNTCVQNTCRAQYTLGGMVSGLQGTVVLQNNGGNDLTLTQNAGFTFGGLVTQGTAYAVTVRTQPVGQTCTVTNGAATMGGANVNNVSVACVGNAYTVGGSVSGLTGTVVLQNNGGSNLSLTASGLFTFGAMVPTGSPYAVTVLTQPANQTCTVTSGSGTMGNINVNNVSVACVGNAYTVGGSVSGLTGTVVLQNNGGSNLSLTASGLFTFGGTVPAGSPYAVTVLTQPANQNCSVTGGSGTSSTNVTNVSVVCFDNPIGGTITTSGAFRIHTFTSPGTFQTFGPLSVDYVIVAGGGGGGSGDGGGGGAGGVLMGTTDILTNSYTIVVGAGGAGAGLGELGSASQNGFDSVFSGFTAIGGGRGGQEDNFSGGGPLNNGGNGGSGGGYGGGNGSVLLPGGSGTAGQGMNGGTRPNTSNWGMGGGGGAGGIGSNGSGANVGGAGGVGIASSVSGISVFYGGGGGGSGRSGTGGVGGNGGGGNGGLNANGTPGSPNTGGGGGGGGDQARTGGAGGSGIVIVRYLGSGGGPS